ncbi:DNA-entry nuclease [Brevibacillus sp. JB24b]|uniref:DNA-entry nuclease n=1 Tax=Brevibacillus sp. JB24b TaxID=3422308 RepID=UPI003F6851A5
MISENHRDAIEYDKKGRLKYHPDFHPNQKKAFTTHELAYICHFCETDNIKSLALGLGRLEGSVSTQISFLKKKKLFNHYKELGKRIYT